MKKIFITLFFILFILQNNTLSIEESVCGNKSCEIGESIDNCPSDCNLFEANNNGVCGFQENIKNSPADCNINCGNGICEKSEIYNCPKDCLGKGSLLKKEKTNFNNAALFQYNVKRSKEDIKPYLAYIKNNKSVDYYFDTLFLIDRYFTADNIEEWLEFIDYNFVDNFKYKIKWLSKDNNNNFALIKKKGLLKSNAFYQDININEGKYKLTYHLNSNTSKFNDFVIGIIFLDDNNKEIIDKNIGLMYSNYLNSYFKYPNINILNNWEKQELSFFVPKRAKSIKIYFQSIHNTADFKIDNIYLSEIDKPDKNILCNGDFENPSICWKNLYPLRNINHSFSENEKAPIKIIDQVMGEVNRDLNRNNKLKIAIAIPWGWTIFEKGMKDLNQLYKEKKYEERKNLFKYAFKKYVDRTLELWNKTEIKNLELIGFYLDDEGASPLSTQEEWIKYLQEYIKSKNLKLYISPYNDVPYEEQVKTFLRGYYSGSSSWPKNLYKFIDGVWTQPNVWPPSYMWSKNYDQNKNYSFPHSINNKNIKDILPNEKVNPNDINSPNKNIPASNFCVDINPKSLAENGVPLCELAETISFGYKNDIGILVEWVEGLENNKAYGKGYYGRIIDYISYFTDFGFLKSSFLYFEGGYLLKCFKSNNPIYKNQYDYVYEFIKKSRE